MDKQTIAYYDNHAGEYCRETRAIELRELYDYLLDQMPAGAHILDAGSGSGRDTKHFLELGYQVTAFDASVALVAESTAFTGQQTLLKTFADVQWIEQFDGIWACASLLHLTRQEFFKAFEKLMKALKIGGVFYFSVKRGEGSGTDERGRFFTYYREEEFIECFDGREDVGLVWAWVGKSAGQEWVNCLLKKV